jgi:hypothetical protein
MGKILSCPICGSPDVAVVPRAQFSAEPTAPEVLGHRCENGHLFVRNSAPLTQSEHIRARVAAIIRSSKVNIAQTRRLLAESKVRVHKKLKDTDRKE